MLHRGDERKQAAHGLRIFKVVLVVLAFLAVADIFLPEPFHLGFDRAASLIFGCVGNRIPGDFPWLGKLGRSHRLAQMELLACYFYDCHLRNHANARFAYQESANLSPPIVVAAIVFFWSFGLLRRIDRNNAEMHSLGITREFSGPMPEIPAVEPKIASNRHKLKRHKKH